MKEISKENSGRKMGILSVLECDDFARIMTIKHGSNIRQKRFSIKCSEGKEGVFVEVVLFNDKQSFYYQV